jgi:hypothetical protein
VYKQKCSIVQNASTYVRCTTVQCTSTHEKINEDAKLLRLTIAKSQGAVPLRHIIAQFYDQAGKRRESTGGEREKTGSERGEERGEEEEGEGEGGGGGVQTGRGSQVGRHLHSLICHNTLFYIH